MKRSIPIMFATLLLCAMSTIALNSAEADIFANEKDTPSEAQRYGLPVSHEELDEMEETHKHSSFHHDVIHEQTEQETSAAPTEHKVDIQTHEWQKNDGKTGDGVKRTFYVGKAYVKEIIGQALEGNRHAIATFESPEFLKRFCENYNTAEKQEVLQALEDRANNSPDDSTIIKQNLQMIIKKLNDLTLKTGQDIYHNDLTGKHRIVLYKKGDIRNSEIDAYLGLDFKAKLQTENPKYRDIINQRYLSLTDDAQRKIFIDTLNAQEHSKLSIENIIDTAYDTAVKALPTKPSWQEKLNSYWKPKSKATNIADWNEGFTEHKTVEQGTTEDDYITSSGNEKYHSFFDQNEPDEDSRSILGLHRPSTIVQDQEDGSNKTTVTDWTHILTSGQDENDPIILSPHSSSDDGFAQKKPINWNDL